MTLDLGPPGIDGIETCRRVREITDAYVVMITARDDEIDQLLGLETADDFLSKPFSVRELKACVNALFRRPPEHGPLRVDVDGCRAFEDAEELALTRTQLDLLAELMRTPARVWTREALLR